MDYLRPLVDLRRIDNDPKLFGIALALRHMRILIQHGESEMERPDNDPVLQPHHVEVSFLPHLSRHSALQNWAINGSLLMRRKHFLKDQERGKDSTDVGL